MREVVAAMPKKSQDFYGALDFSRLSATRSPRSCRTIGRPSFPSEGICHDNLHSISLAREPAVRSVSKRNVVEADFSRSGTSSVGSPTRLRGSAPQGPRGVSGLPRARSPRGSVQDGLPEGAGWICVLEAYSRVDATPPRSARIPTCARTWGLCRTPLRASRGAG